MKSEKSKGLFKSFDEILKKSAKHKTEMEHYWKNAKEIDEICDEMDEIWEDLAKQDPQTAAYLWMTDGWQKEADAAKRKSSTFWSKVKKFFN